MKGIDELIPKAIEAIKKSNISDSMGMVVNEYKGYIDTFGASIVQNGLIPAIIFFEAGGKEGEPNTSDPQKQGTYENRKKLMKAILDLIPVKEKGNATTLFDYVTHQKDNKIDEKQIRQKVVDAAIAVKLALRTFAIKKKDDNDKPGQ